MKINRIAISKKPLAWLIIICLPLAISLLAPVTAYSDTTSDARTQAVPGIPDTVKTPSNITAYHPEARNLAGSPSPQKAAPTRQKKTLNDGSRELSAFFILGIAINIIMIITFAWWFSRQWRLTGK